MFVADATATGIVGHGSKRAVAATIARVHVGMEHGEGLLHGREEGVSEDALQR